MLDARVREREGCVLVADKCGGMTRVVMAMLRELAVEIVFASRVVSVILPCGYCRSSGGATMVSARSERR